MSNHDPLDPGVDTTIELEETAEDQSVEGHGVNHRPLDSGAGPARDAGERRVRA